MKQDENFKKNFQKKVIKRMNALGISQKELSRKLKLSEQTVSHYILGKSVPKVTTIQHMANALECDAGWLACFRSSGKTIEEDDQQEEGSGWIERPEGGWTEETLPPKRGQNGANPYCYHLVVEYKKSMASTEAGKPVDIIVQGIGWLNDVWKDKTGFIMYAQQLTNTKLAYIHDKPVAFRYSQLIAWKEIEAYEERRK